MIVLSFESIKLYGTWGGEGGGALKGIRTNEAHQNIMKITKIRV